MTAQPQPLKPHSFSTVSINNDLTPAQREQKYRALGPIAARHGRFPKGTVLPETIVSACPRVRVADLPEGFLKQKWIDQQEQNQLIASCCRHPEHHDIEAFRSHKDEQVPDIYILYCTCGRRHIKFCAGMTDPHRPEWQAS